MYNEKIWKEFDIDSEIQKTEQSRIEKLEKIERLMILQRIIDEIRPLIQSGNGGYYK